MRFAQPEILWLLWTLPLLVLLLAAARSGGDGVERRGGILLFKVDLASLKVL